jgi:hypothetical protein
MVEKKKKANKEKVCEVFDVSDGKNEQKKVSCGEMDIKHASKLQSKEFNKTLRNILIFLGFLVALFILIFFLVNSSNSLVYKGTEYEKLQQGTVVFYHTTIPYSLNGRDTLFNIYLRNNPKELSKDIYLSDSDLAWKNLIILNFSQRYPECDGDDVIAEANFNQVLKDGMKLSVGKNENASFEGCGKYLYFELLEGEETKIERIGTACYKLYFDNCEILPITERILIEAVSEYNKNSK